ncbi:MAG TPA: nitrilase-related carbon-nitrogen hydrolase, partial [Vicinamibacterales bacterium]|nr:nitrilase-related carbon-nitrogen hydrolase [Vicinamibacterales bacterium]
MKPISRTCIVAALLLGASGTLLHSKAGRAGTSTLRIAVVQMQSGDHDIDGNLKRATAFADEAAAKGAQFVLFPELMPTGSYLFYDTWDAGEPSDGKTVRWLKSTSRRLHIWLGT